MAAFVWVTFGFSTAEVVRGNNSDKERMTLPREQLPLAGVGRVGAPKNAALPEGLP